MSFVFQPIAVLVVTTILSFSAPGAIGTMWRPLCPDRTECATTFPPFVTGRKVLISSSANAGPNHWIDSVKFTSATTPMHLPSLGVLQGFMSVGLTGGNVYDRNGQPLYSFNHTGFGPEATGFNFETLGPAVATYGAVFPPPIVTGVAGGAGLPTIYQSRDEGRTWVQQTANVQMSATYVNGPLRTSRTNFVLSPGHGVWVVPGPVTPGLWRTPALAALLDFAHLDRIDDGSFPADVFQLRSWRNQQEESDGYMVALSSDGMYKSTDFGRTWSRGTFSGIVDDIDFVDTPEALVPLLPNTQVIAARGSVFISRDRGQTWSPFAHGLPYDRYSITRLDLAGVTTVIAAGAGGAFVCPTGYRPVCDGEGFGNVQTAGTSFARIVEFYHPTLDHYFISGDESEQQSVRNGGAGPGWIETGDSFWAWSPEWRQESAYVCRFYGDAQYGPNSHFFSASSNECRGLLALEEGGPGQQPRWVSEGYAFKAALPNAAGGCAAGLVPIYRAYNNGFARGLESNHRFVSRRELLAPLVAIGWTEEGIAFCTPAAAS